MNLLDLLVKVGVQDDASQAVDQVSGNIVGKLTETAKTAAKVMAGMWVTKKVMDFGRAAYDAYSQFEQLSGGAAKIFDEIDQSSILNDANDAWRTLNMSANEYLSSINQTGAMFAQTMGDEAGYETAKKGMQAISDYATGTGRDINELNTKFGMITRSTSSYQSIADQFAGILPATSADFLEQAQAAGFLSDAYTSLTEVPVAEYQQAVTSILEKGVSDLGLAGNTAKEALTTLEGSTLAAKSAWKNLVAEFGKPDADIGARISDMLTAVLGEGGEGGLLRNVAGEVKVIATNMIRAVSDGVVAGFRWLVDNGPTLALNAVRGVVDAMTGAAASIGSFDLSSMLEDLDASGIVDSLMSSLGDVGEIIREWAPDVAEAAAGLASSIGAAVAENAPFILDTVGGVLSDIGSAILDRGPELAGAAAEALMGLVETVTSHGPEVAEAVGNVIEAIAQFLVDHGPEILAAAGEMVSNIGAAIVEHGPTILSNMAETVGGLISHVAGAAGLMLQAGLEFIGGLLSGSETGFADVKTFFSGIPGKIVSALGSVGSLLTGIGSSIIDGFLSGMKSAWESVTSWVSGLGSWIQEHKGPEEYDKRLLVGNGLLIMRGLGSGLTKGFDRVKRILAYETSEINDKFRDGLDLSVTSRQDFDSSHVRSSALTDGKDVGGQILAALDDIRRNMDMRVYLDGKALVGGIAPAMNVALGRL